MPIDTKRLKISKDYTSHPRLTYRDDVDLVMLRLFLICTAASKMQSVRRCCHSLGQKPDRGTWRGWWDKWTPGRLPLTLKSLRVFLVVYSGYTNKPVINHIYIIYTYQTIIQHNIWIHMGFINTVHNLNNFMVVNGRRKTTASLASPCGT